MVTIPSAVIDAPNAIHQVETRLNDMERLAESGEWEKIEGGLKRLPQLISRVPLADRRDVLLAARSCIERIRERAVQQSHDTSARLTAIKTGRQAAESYRITSAMTNVSRL